MSKFYLSILFLANILGFVAISSSIQAQINAGGMPFVQNYAPGSESNWSVTQDSRDIMYFGSSEYVMEYDGVNWRKISVPGQGYILSVSEGPDSLIYVGGVNDFGRLTLNKYGNTVYTSLGKQLVDSIEIDRVWKIYADQTSVYFCTLNYIFKYNTEKNKLETIKLYEEDNFWSFYVNDQLYIGNYAKGLLQLNKENIEEVSGGDFFIKKDIFTILSWGSDTLLVGTKQEGLSFFVTSTGEALPFSHTAQAQKTNEKLQSKSLYTATKVGENRFAFGTLDDGLFIINKSGETETHLNKELGLKDQTITDLYYSSHSGMLWLTFTNGMSAVNVKSPIRRFGTESGLEGSLYGIAEYNKEIYVATLLGAFKQNVSTSGNVYFKKTDGIKSGEIVYSLLKFSPNNYTDILLAGSVKDIYKLDGDRAVSLDFNIEINRLVQSTYNPNKIWVATPKGIKEIEYKNKQLQIKKDTLGFPEKSIIRIVEDKEGNLWINSLGGIHAANKNGKPQPIPKSIKGKNGTFFKFNSDVILATEKEILKYNYKTDDFEPFNQLNQLFTNKNKKLIDFFQLNDTLALANYTKNDIPKNEFIIKRQDQWHDDTLALQIIPSTNITTAVMRQNYVMMGGVENLFVYNNGMEKKYKTPYNVNIRKITSGEDSVIYEGGSNFFKNERANNTCKHILVKPIDYSFNNMSFEYAAAFYEKKEDVQYSSYLKNFDKNWSPWQENVSRTYTNLKEGSYQFYVKAKNLYGVESRIAVFEFEILPPWYRTWWAIILYFILGLFVIRVAISLYTRKLQEDKRRLEAIVKERTAEIVEKNKHIEQQNIAITDSIRYAERIQTAVLPNKLKTDRFEHFIYFEPKDIVSGDFFWVQNLEKQNKLIAVAADCTGHGVPGAFMSMLGTSFLNEIVPDFDEIHAELILNQLRDKVIRTLNQGLNTNNKEERKDGMDMALVSIDLETMMLEYAGANNPLVLIRDNEIIEYKPDKMPIGAYVKQNIPFKRQEIQLQPGDTFYTFSDGYVDQFGGEKDRKYMKKRFKEFLLAIHEKPLKEQKQLLKQEMKDWIGDRDQIDDQIVIGMKFIQ